MNLLLAGTIGTGKTTALASYIMQDIMAGRSLTLIDPMGALYKRIVAFICYLKGIGVSVPEVILFNPSEGEWCLPVNFFARKHGDLGVAVDRRVTAILRAWGQASGNDTPRLERWLRTLLTVLMECGLTLVDAGVLIDRNHAAVREQFAAKLHNPLIRAKFEALSSYKPSEFNEQLESLENRLMRFLTSDTLRRILGTGKNALDLSGVIEGKNLLVDLQPSPFLSYEQGRLIGTMILTEEYEIALQRPTGARPHYVYVDEAHRYVTPELALALEQTRQKGLHYTLATQHLSQFRTEDDGRDRVYKAIKNCVRNKIVFAIPDRVDASDIADDVFTGLTEPEVKFVHTRLNHRIEDVRDQSISRTQGQSESWGTSSTRSTGVTDSYGESFGDSSSTSTGISSEQSVGRSRTFSRGKTHQTSRGKSDSETENESHSQGFSSSSSSHRASDSSSSRSETVNRGNDAGFFESDERSRSMTRGGSQSRSQSESYSRTDTGNDSYSRGSSSTRSRSESRGGNKSLAWSKSRSAMQGRSRSISSGQTSQETSSTSNAQSESEGTSHSVGRNQSYSVTDQPSARHHPFLEQDPEFFGLEERRWRASESLMWQNTGCCYASTLAGSGFGHTPLPKPFYILSKQLQQSTCYLYEKHNLLPALADQLLAERHEELLSLTITDRPESPADFAANGTPTETPIWNRQNGSATNGTKPSLGRAKQRGPQADHENHARVAIIVSSYGENWRSDDTLAEICEKLDELGVPVPKTWPELRKNPARTWRRAFAFLRDRVKKAIEYHCTAARQASS